MQLSLLPVTTPHQVYREPTVAHRSARVDDATEVSLRYVFPGMEHVAKHFFLDPNSLSVEDAVRLRALHEEGEVHLDHLVERLAEDLMPHGYDHGSSPADGTTTHLSQHHASPVLAIRSRRKSLASLAEKVRRYEALTTEDVRMMMQNGYQARFTLDKETGHRVYTIADGNGLVIVAPTVEVIYDIIVPALKKHMAIVPPLKDYIAYPKPLTGYQSLHAIGFGHGSSFMTEVQVRTPEMDRKAHSELAATYHQNKELYSSPPRRKPQQMQLLR